MEGPSKGVIPPFSPLLGPGEAVLDPDPGRAMGPGARAQGTGWETGGRADAAEWDPAMLAPDQVQAGTARVRALAGWSWNFPSHAGRMCLELNRIRLRPFGNYPPPPRCSITYGPKTRFWER